MKIITTLALALGLSLWAAPAHASPHPHVVGHRAVQGPKAGTNENTLAALAKDHRLGARFETDQWNLASADGTPNAGPPVIFHDSTLGRVVSPASLATAGLAPSTYIGNVTLTQFRLLRTKGGQPLPTLHEWVDHAVAWHVKGMVEIKYLPNHPTIVARWLRGTGISVYTSPHLWNGVCTRPAAETFIGLGIRTGLKVNYQCPLTLEQTAAFGYRFVVGPAPTKTEVDTAHALGLRIGNFDSFNPEQWQSLVDAGVDFIIAAHPGACLHWLEGRS